MQLNLQNIVPHHLRDKAALPSAIWGKDITFTQGDCIFVLAPSGAGKSTLLHSLYGLRTDYDGVIHWDNTNPAAANDDTLSRLRTNDLSIVFQDLRLFPQLTALGNITVKAQLTHTTANEQIEAWMQQLGIHHKKAALAGTMSYGEQQRIAIIRALVQPFKWLLMDEPFSHLDKANRDKAIALITEVTAMRNAGMFIADLDANNYFSYTHTLML